MPLSAQGARQLADYDRTRPAWNTRRLQDVSPHMLRFLETLDEDDKHTFIQGHTLHAVIPPRRRGEKTDTLVRRVVAFMTAAVQRHTDLLRTFARLPIPEQTLTRSGTSLYIVRHILAFYTHCALQLAMAAEELADETRASVASLRDVALLASRETGAPPAQVRALFEAIQALGQVAPAEEREHLTDMVMADIEDAEANPATAPVSPLEATQRVILVEMMEAMTTPAAMPVATQGPSTQGPSNPRNDRNIDDLVALLESADVAGPSTAPAGRVAKKKKRSGAAARRAGPAQPVANAPPSLPSTFTTPTPDLTDTENLWTRVVRRGSLRDRIHRVYRLDDALTFDGYSRADVNRAHGTVLVYPRADHDRHISIAPRDLRHPRLPHHPRRRPLLLRCPGPPPPDHPECPSLLPGSRRGHSAERTAFHSPSAEAQGLRSQSKSPALQQPPPAGPVACDAWGARVVCEPTNRQ